MDTDKHRLKLKLVGRASSRAEAIKLSGYARLVRTLAPPIHQNQFVFVREIRVGFVFAPKIGNDYGKRKEAGHYSGLN
jgi:hypothetical protein